MLLDWFGQGGGLPSRRPRRRRLCTPAVEGLEARALLSAGAAVPIACVPAIADAGHTSTAAVAPKVLGSILGGRHVTLTHLVGVPHRRHRRHHATISTPANVTPTPPPISTDQLQGTGVSGVVRIGPILPVTQFGVPNDRPLAGAVLTVQPAGGGAELARTQADANGNFSLALPPGDYLLVPLPLQPGQFLPRGETQTVQVGADGYTTVTVEYDTGIR
jgi:hypothetical protein